MYRPAAFRQDDLTALHAQIDSTGLALLTSNSPAGLQATHLPLLLAAEDSEFGTLYGHFARANPHWQDLAGQEALAVFAGPDAYVHPGWYPGKAEHGQVVPTWNYIAVHAWGQVETFDDPARLRELLTRLTARHEAGRPRPWSLDDAPAEYLERMLRAIVGFALPIRRIEGQWKLSQNRQPADHAGVREGLAASANPRDRELAARMNPR